MHRPIRAGSTNYTIAELFADEDPGVAADLLSTAIVAADSVTNRFVGGVARVSLGSLRARHGDPAVSIDDSPTRSNTGVVEDCTPTSSRRFATLSSCSIVSSNRPVTELHGDHRLRTVTLSEPNGAEVYDTQALFSFIGATPATDWLAGFVETDDDGFVRTCRNLAPGGSDLPWRGIGRIPLPYETSQPGLFTVGDVRAGSINVSPPPSAKVPQSSGPCTSTACRRPDRRTDPIPRCTGTGHLLRVIALSTVVEDDDQPDATEMIRRLVKDQETVARTARSVFPIVEHAHDKPTADLLTQRLLVHEKTAWMLRTRMNPANT